MKDEPFCAFIHQCSRNTPYALYNYIKYPLGFPQLTYQDCRGGKTAQRLRPHVSMGPHRGSYSGILHNKDQAYS